MHALKRRRTMSQDRAQPGDEFGGTRFVHQPLDSTRREIRLLRLRRRRSSDGSNIECQLHHVILKKAIFDTGYTLRSPILGATPVCSILHGSMMLNITLGQICSAFANNIVAASDSRAGNGQTDFGLIRSVLISQATMNATTRLN